MDIFKKLLRYSGRKIVIYDIDNTLFDVRERYWRSLEDVGIDPLKGIEKVRGVNRRRFWEIFLSNKYLHLDKPSMKNIEEVNSKYDEGYIVIILTGRPERLRKDTEEQLKKYGVKYHLLIMRPEGNREPDYIYKVNVINELINAGLNIVEYHEDDDKTIDRIRKLYPQIKVYKHDLSREHFFFYDE